VGLEVFQDFQAILCNKLHERIERIRLNYVWIYQTTLDDIAKLAIASGRGATTEDEKIAQRLHHEIEGELNDYCEPILREHELQMRSLVDWFNTKEEQKTREELKEPQQEPSAIGHRD